MNRPAAAVFGMITARGRTDGDRNVAFSGLFPAEGRSDWPRGVQESDAPRFDVRHAAALRPGAVPASGSSALNEDEDGFEGEIVELFNRRLR